ncbi:hypothetical protein BJV78DRAFT_1230243 [Lactifluus subvellereus]|nr:hypothetical protein BJV78DRAFT_1230243 [Lactifluus subvellereus]
MRFFVLTLLISLPAVAYAAVCPQQLSIDSEVACAERGHWCNDEIPCCGRLQCAFNGFSRVCPNAQPLRLTLNTGLNTGMCVRS